MEKILADGKSARTGDVAIPTEDEIRVAEHDLGFRFPESYREFMRLGGLDELRINHLVLRPAEIVRSLHHLRNTQYVPFADNGYGDVFCWQRTNTIEPAVVVIDHETDNCTQVAESFTQWLQQNRF